MAFDRSHNHAGQAPVLTSHHQRERHKPSDRWTGNQIAQIASTKHNHTSFPAPGTKNNYAHVEILRLYSKKTHRLKNNVLTI